MKGTKREDDKAGSLSVHSTPGGISGTLSGKGTSTMVALVPESESTMKGRFKGVVKTVTEMSPAKEWDKRRRANWSIGIMCPLDKYGNKTT